MTLIPVRSFRELDQRLGEAADIASTADGIDFLTRHFLDVSHPFPDDPFSREYHAQAVEFYRLLSGRSDYHADENEQVSCPPDVRSPSPYDIGSGVAVGNQLIAWGFVLRTLELKAGQSLLEYGPGTGQLLINAARMGVRAAGIDINPHYVELIREQARRLEVDIRIEIGKFGDTPEPGKRYDAVLFYEAFHHCLDHVALVDRLHDVVTDEGVFAVCGEPILDEANPFRSVVPFPWGPRLDLLSVRATRTHGWMELGFQEEYFVRLLHRGGWLVRKYPCPLYPGADTYVARKNHGRTSAGELFLPATEAATWHTPEGPLRWSRGRSILTLDSRPRWSTATVTLTSQNPRPTSVEVACGSNQVRARLSPGETRPVTISLPGGTRLLEVVSPVFCPKPVGLGEDSRQLGVMVGEIAYS